MTYPISQGATEIADPSVTVGETITVNSGMTITVDGESTTMIMPWSGNSDTSWHNSAETEFIITTPEQLAGLSKLVSDGNSFTGKTIKLANDLNMNNLLWTPIGARTRNSTTLASSTLFKGSFDGQDHVIRNLYVYQEEGVDEDSVSGLFGVIAGASISNLRLEDSTITDSSDTAGGIVGAIIAETDETTLITNCHSNATVHGKGAAAGILGRAYGSGTITITNCTNSGSISSDDKAGGITAINNSTANTTISGCSNSGAISNADSGAGGILGYANNNIKIENAENSGPVTAGRYGGGIVGYTSNTNDEPSYVMTIVSNTAAIHAENTAGGIIGLGQKFTITNATNSGAITSDQFAGGIAGSMTGMTITDSKNTAAVHGEYYAGGIAGDLQGNNSVSTTSGGTAAITTGEPTIGTLQASNGTTYSDYRGYAGRLFGSLANSPNRSTASKLTVDDTNGDSYADLGTIGIIGHASGWGGLIVEGGTFHGIPAIGGGPGQIEFSADAEWNGYEMTEGETVYRLTRDSESGQTKVAPQAWYAQ